MHLRTYSKICSNTYIHTRTYILIFIYIHIHIYLYVYIHIYTYIYIHTHICIHSFSYMYIHIYICAYINTYRTVYKYTPIRAYIYQKTSLQLTLKYTLKTNYMPVLSRLTRRGISYGIYIRGLGSIKITGLFCRISSLL